MNRIVVNFLLALLIVGCQASNRGVDTGKPNISLAKTLLHPTDADLARLESTKGKTKSQVIAILGHPKKISFNSEGAEMWDYPWVAACRVWFKNGVVADTYYTAGY